MKTILGTVTLLFCLLLTSLLTAQTTVRLETPKCNGKMQVFAINGAGYVQHQRLKTFQEEVMEEGEKKLINVFTWEAADTKPRIYFIGTSMRDYFPILVGKDPEILVKGECGRLNQVQIINSPSNVAYQNVLRQLNQNNANYSALAQKNRGAKDEATKAEVMASMKALDAAKIALVNSTKEQDPFLGRIAAMNTYLSFMAADQTKYPSGLEHYLKTIWQFTDFNDAGYEDMNVVYEASVNYAKTLLSAMSSKDLERVMLTYADRWPAGSKARMYALGGLYASTSARNNPAALAVAEKMVNEYKATHPQVVASVEKSFNKLRTSTPGATAPTFSGTAPDGSTVDLKDLRGKVVLLDFWASWCGPCRRENPNLVKMYEKYADQGIEILGVSLDRDKARWEKAIADDKLTWLHISDLKHWRSEYAALYGVRSIPDTILLDAEGKIIARNLRGKQLEQKLATIFGEGK